MDLEEGYDFPTSTCLWCTELHRLGVWRLPKFHVHDPQFTSELETLVSQKDWLYLEPAQVSSAYRLPFGRYASSMPFGLGFRSAVDHFALRKSPSLFPYPGILTRSLHSFEYSLGEGALGCSQTVEASLSPRYKSCCFWLLDWTYWDVTVYIPLWNCNGEGISRKPKEVQLPQLQATRSTFCSVSVWTNSCSRNCRQTKESHCFSL
jgi:hypothetical protein